MCPIYRNLGFFCSLCHSLQNTYLTDEAEQVVRDSAGNDVEIEF